MVRLGVPRFLPCWGRLWLPHRTARISLLVVICSMTRSASASGRRCRRTTTVTSARSTGWPVIPTVLEFSTSAKSLRKSTSSSKRAAAALCRRCAVAPMPILTRVSARPTSLPPLRSSRCTRRTSGAKRDVRLDRRVLLLCVSLPSLPPMRCMAAICLLILLAAASVSAKTVRVFAVGNKLEIRYAGSYRDFRDKMFALVDAQHPRRGELVQADVDDVASPVQPADPQAPALALVNFPADVGLGA